VSYTPPFDREMWDDKPSYVRRPLSNYEGFRRLELGLERSARMRDHRKLCLMCKQWKNSRHLVPSELLGRMVPPFTVKMLECCEECATTLRRTGIP
jgi:hypothetical protein